MDIDHKVVEDLQSGDDEMLMMDLRRGPWTVEEDLNLINNIAKHGDGRWNSLARSAGLRRTGKSCRLRWLNYLRPDVRRGNITPKEQLLILELHSRWGNRWSKIAQHLPGRTDNEIKNYWRTRVQKHAKQLKCDVNSKQFKDTMRYLWMPRLVERIQVASSTAATSAYQFNHSNLYSSGDIITTPETICGGYTSENSSMTTSSDSLKTGVSQISDLTENYYPVINNNNNNYQYDNSNCYYYPVGYSETLINTSGNLTQLGMDNKPMEESNETWFDNYNGDTISDTTMLWNVEDIWFLKQAAALQQHPFN